MFTQKIKLFVMFSGNASAVQYLKDNDPDWDYQYQVVGALTDKHDAPGISFFKGEDIFCHCADQSTFLSTGIPSAKKDEYFGYVGDIIDERNPDYIVFSGFMLIVPNRFIRRFERRIINVHPTDLSIVDTVTRKRRYTGRGDRAIKNALNDGLTSIRSTIHFVEEGDVDEGEIIAHSRTCVIAPRDTAQTLQDRLKLVADGDALKNALKILCQTKTGTTEVA